VTEETYIAMWPLWVKSNFPKEIVGWVLKYMNMDFISAIVGKRKRSVKKRKRKGI